MPSLPAGRILIVDDESNHMTALCDTLRDHGYVTSGVSTGNAALRAMRESEFDLILTDLQMPEMDGISLLRAAKELDHHMVGIVMTGHGTIDTAVEAMKAGALDYILKPFKLSVAIPVLSRALAVRHLRLENAALERRVLERTAELEAANRELEAFSHSISHDLQAPLRHIDGFAKLLIEGYAQQLPPPAQRFLQNINDGAQRLAHLIDDLLSFSRFNRQALLRRQVNLTDLVQEVIDQLHLDRENRKIEIRLSPLPDWVADPALLRQVFVNLLSNAVKFTRHREEALVLVGCQEKPDEIILSVQDNGAGFDMLYVDKLFGVFQRLHRVEEFEGTGVGLSIVQRIVQRHGGRIWAEAVIDQGATFHFTLPKTNGYAT